MSDFNKLWSEFIGLCADIAKTECEESCDPLKGCNRCRLVTSMLKRKEAAHAIRRKHAAAELREGKNAD